MLEVVVEHAQRLARLERRHRRRPPLLRDQRQLAERLTREANREERVFAERRPPRDREPPRHDEMERLREVVLVEDDLAAVEPAPPLDRQHALHVLLRHPREELLLNLPVLRRMSPI